MVRGRVPKARPRLPQYTNNYEYEPMDLDGDGFLDLVTNNDGEILREQSDNRREHVLRNDGKGRFRDATAQWWPADQNVGEDDGMVAFLDFDSDGDADFVIGSLSGPDRLLINDGKGGLTVALDVFAGPATPGTLGIALADLDGDGRMDVVQAQGEHPTAVQERIALGTGLKADTAPPSITLVGATPPNANGRVSIRARVHDRKSPSLGTEWKQVVVEWSSPAGPQPTPMRWYGEYLWRIEMPAGFTATTSYRGSLPLTPRAMPRVRTCACWPCPRRAPARVLAQPRLTSVRPGHPAIDIRLSVLNVLVTGEGVGGEVRTEPKLNQTTVLAPVLSAASCWRIYWSAGKCRVIANQALSQLS